MDVQRLKESSLYAVVLATAMIISWSVLDGRFDPVRAGGLLIGVVLVTYLIWPVANRSGKLRIEPKVKNVALGIIAAASGALIVRVIPDLTGWNTLVVTLLLIGGVMAVGEVWSRLKAHRGQPT